jgi:hypothetical protein
LPLQECISKTTSSEFKDWIKYIHWKEWEENSRLHYYLARIACEIYNFRMMFTTSGKAKPIEDFLLKFESKEETKPELAAESRPEVPKDLTPEEEEKLKKELSVKVLAHFGHLIESGMAEYKPHGDTNNQGA